MQQSKSYLLSQVGTPNKFSQRNTNFRMLHWQTQRQRQCFSPRTPVPGRLGRSTHKGCVPCVPSVGSDRPKDRLGSPRKLGWNSDPALTNASAQWRKASALLSENGDEMVSSRWRLQCGLNKTEGLVNIYTVTSVCTCHSRGSLSVMWGTFLLCHYYYYQWFW